MATQTVETPPSDIKEPTTPVVEIDTYVGDRLGFIFILVLVSSGVLVLLIALFFMMQPIRSPVPLFFKASQNAELIEEIPLNQSNMEANVLFNWLVQGIISIHSFNFVNYATRLEATRDYFTPEGFDSFTQALKQSQILDQVISQKFVFTGMPTAAPQIIKEGVLADRYLWKLKIPVFFQYRNIASNLNDEADLILLIVRVPTTVSPYGVKILRYELILKRSPGQ